MPYQKYQKRRRSHERRGSALISFLQPLQQGAVREKPQPDPRSKLPGRRYGNHRWGDQERFYNQWQDACWRDGKLGCRLSHLIHHRVES